MFYSTMNHVDDKNRLIARHATQVAYDTLFQFHFIGDTALASLLTSSRAKCTVFVIRLSLPCFTFEMKLELLAKPAACGSNRLLPFPHSLLHAPAIMSK